MSKYWSLLPKHLHCFSCLSTTSISSRVQCFYLIFQGAINTMDRLPTHHKATQWHRINNHVHRHTVCLSQRLCIDFYLFFLQSVGVFRPGIHLSRGPYKKQTFLFLLCAVCFDFVLSWKCTIICKQSHCSHLTEMTGRYRSQTPKKTNMEVLFPVFVCYSNCDAT